MQIFDESALDQYCLLGPSSDMYKVAKIIKICYAY